jgi:hypothetical protein
MQRLVIITILVNNPIFLYMAKSIKLADTQQVTEHIKKLDPAVGKIVQGALWH